VRLLTMSCILLCLLALPGAARAGDDAGHVAGLPMLSPGVLIDAVPGEGASTSHPRGTVLVAASLASCGPAIVEWDLARERVARQACLGLPEADMRLARAGSTLQVLANGRSRILKRLDVASLRVEHTLDLGAASYTGIATDGTITAVASAADGELGSVWELVTVDGGGRVLGRLRAAGRVSGPVQMVASGGRAFLVLRERPPMDPSPRLVALGADATIIRSIPLEPSTDDPSLALKGDRLLVGLGTKLVELSRNLDVLASHPLSVGGSLAVSPDGRILTGEGDLLSGGFKVERHLMVGEPWVHAVLWAGSTPVVIGSFAEVVRHARIHWWDPV
jgi:hypothetical protein